jgi:malonate transporter
VSTINTSLLNALVPVFFGLGLGYYAGKRGRVDNRNVAALNNTLMHFVLPCSLFLAMGRTSASVLRSQAMLLAIVASGMAITYVLVFACELQLFRKTAGESSTQALTVSFANNVAVGLPVLASIYGTMGTLSATAAIMAGALVVSPVTLVVLECHAAGGTPRPRTLGSQIGHAILQSLRRPVVLAPLCGLLFPLTGHALPTVAASSLELIGKATIGLALFLTGLILSAQSLRFSKSVMIGVFLKNAGQPAIFFLLILAFHQHGQTARAAFLLAAVPAGFFGTVFGARYGISSTEVSSTLVLSTVLSVVTLPIALLLSAYLP